MLLLGLFVSPQAYAALEKISASVTDDVNCGIPDCVLSLDLCPHNCIFRTTDQAAPLSLVERGYRPRHISFDRRFLHPHLHLQCRCRQFPCVWILTSHCESNCCLRNATIPSWYIRQVDWRSGRQKATANGIGSSETPAQRNATNADVANWECHASRRRIRLSAV